MNTHFNVSDQELAAATGGIDMSAGSSGKFLISELFKQLGALDKARQLPKPAGEFSMERFNQMRRNTGLK